MGSPAVNPSKPSVGSPCNGCGLCCFLEQCAMGKDLAPAKPGKACEMIYSDGERYFCGFVVEADKEFRPVVELVLGVGVGCDSNAPEGPW